MHLRKIIYNPILALLFVVCCSSLWSQRLDGDSEVTMILSDNTEVTLFKTFAFEEEAHLFYYLPVNLRFSVKKDNTPEFSFMTYKEEEDGEISGALMHWLITWGLTAEQENEVQDRLEAEIDSVGVLMGAVQVDQISGKPAFEIISETPISDILMNSLKTVGGIPLYPGSKMAASFFFQADDAKAMEKALLDKKQMKDLFIRLHFQLPALYSTNTHTVIRRNHLLQTDFEKLMKTTNRFTQG